MMSLRSLGSAEFGRRCGAPLAGIVFSSLFASAIVSAMGCSLVLSPSRRQASDAGVLDTPSVDAPLADTPSVDAPRDVDPTVDTGPDAGSDGGAACPADLECAPAAPAGWSGPVVLVSGAGDAAPPACPSTAPSTAFATRSGASAAPTTCNCSCTPPATGLTCGSATLGRSTSSCLTIPTAIATLADGECRGVTMPNTGGWTVSRPPFSAPGTSCTAVPATVIPPVTWTASHRGCGFGTPTSCGAAAACAPTRLTGQRLCVYVDGEASCPSSFPDQLSTAEDVTDTRGCAACSCGGVTGMCSGSVTLTNGCPGTLFVSEVSVAGCTAAFSTSGVSATADYTATASCPPNAPSPTGTTVPTTTRTVCCLPE